MSEVKRSTLCWECAKAIGKCSWSEDLIPIKGWKAIPTRIKTTNGNAMESYLITECPEFKRDAIVNGLKRYEENTDVAV